MPYTHVQPYERAVTPRVLVHWGATLILSGRTTFMMAGGEESKAA